jgi:hypothetical protein
MTYNGGCFVLQAKKTIDFGLLPVGGLVGLVGRAEKAGLDAASGCHVL